MSGVGRSPVAHQGWDSVTDLVDGCWIERTPRRAEIRPLLEAETRLMPRVAALVGLEVPVPAAVHDEGPWRVRHRLVPGDPVVPRRLSREDGARVGAFLRVLHDAPPEVWAGVGLTADADRAPLLEEMAATVVPLLPTDLRGHGLALLDRCVAAVHDGSALRHGDLGPQHLLTTGGHVTGVIDWTDAAVGDPALDLAWTVHRTPSAFAEALVAAYGPTAEELARSADWNLLGPWWEVRHGLTGGGDEYVTSGLDGVVGRLRGLP